MGLQEVELVRRGYEAFAVRDFDTVREVLAPDVRWHGHDEEDPQSGCRDRGQVIEYISRALANGVTVDVREIREAGERVLVVLQSDREDGDGSPRPHGELVTVRGGKIGAMIVYETVEQAEAAAHAT